MRSVLIGCALACLLASYPQVSASTVASAPVISAASPVFALQVPDRKIEITVGDRGGVAWYRSPVWIAIGVLAFIVLILLIVLVSRSGGGTTIIRE